MMSVMRSLFAIPAHKRRTSTTSRQDDDEAGQEERTWTTMTAVEVWEEETTTAIDVGGGRNSQPRGGCSERSYPTLSTMAVVVWEMTTSKRNDNDMSIINKGSAFFARIADPSSVGLRTW